MNIIYHPDLTNCFSDYGIMVPIEYERSQKCFHNLKSDFSQLRELDLSYLPLLTKEDYLRVHNKDFMDRFFDKSLIEFELLKSYELIDKQGNYHRYSPQTAKRPLAKMRDTIFRQVRGTYLTMEKALEENFCFFLGGGMHHAMSFEGRGFCPVHDIMIGLRKLQARGCAGNAWIIDTDAHKGDGTAELTWNDPTVQTLSIHMARGWPLDGPRTDSNGKLNPWFIASTVDIPIPEGGEESYLDKLEKGLHLLSGRPDLGIVVAGADPYEKDQLPSASLLKMSEEQLFKRDLLIYKFMKSKGIPQCWLMGGSYGPFGYKIYMQFLKEVLGFEQKFV